MSISIGAMLGSGIFVLPGLAAAKTGPSVWLAYLVAGVIVLPAALSKSELATAMPTSGGTYVYLEKSFGPIVGTISGIGLWLSLLLKSAFALVGFGAYLHVLADLPLEVTALTLLGLIVVLNIMGVRKVGQAQVVVVVVSLISLVLLILLGFVQPPLDNPSPFFMNGSEGLFSAAAFVFVSYAGVTKVAAIAEEVDNPSRNLPLGMLVSLFLIAGIYALVVFTLIQHVPIAALQNDLRPIYTLAHELGGTAIGALACGIAVLTMTSMANAGLLAASRFPFAMSRDHLIPSTFSEVHHKYLTPVSCILMTGGAMALTILFLEPQSIAKLASAFMIVMYLANNLCVIVLRETSVQWYKPKYLSPFYPWVQIIGSTSCLVLLIVLGKTSLIAISAMTVMGIVLFLLYGVRHTDKQGVLRLYGRRVFLFLTSGKYRVARQESLQKHVELKSIFAHSVPAEEQSNGAGEARVVVPLLGNERSPETLVEVGAALANGSKVRIEHLTEIPDQTMLDAMLDESMAVRSLERRFDAMSEDNHDYHLEFESVVSRDFVRTIRSISERLHCSWIVMDWDGRTGDGLLVQNPLGWLINHLSCNLALFKDGGVRYIRKILVYPEPGPNERLVATTADHLAEIYGASLTFVRVIEPGPNGEERGSANAYLDELRSSCSSRSRNLLLQEENPTQAIINLTTAYDMLVTGSPPEEKLLRVILGTGRDKLTQNSACSVLRLTHPTFHH